MNSARRALASIALITTLFTVYGGAGPPLEAAEIEPLPTYSSIAHRFPTTAFLRPPDVVRFRSTQLMFSLLVDREQLDNMLGQAGWVSDTRYGGDPTSARIQIFWDFSCREQYRGLGFLPGIDNQTTYGPGDAFYVGTSGVSLSDPGDRRYLILMWVVGDADSVVRLNTIHGRTDLTVAYLGDFRMAQSSRSTIGVQSVRSVNAWVREPVSGFSFGLAAVLPTSVAMERVVDDPLGLPVTWLDTSSGATGRTSVWSEQSDYQRFQTGMTPGFYMKLPVGRSLKFPGGWIIDIRKWDDTLNVYTDVEGHGKLQD